jgi:hypothetical protein
MRDPSPYAGKTVRLRADAAELGGHDCEVVDWYGRTDQGRSWRQALEAGDPRAQSYAVRRGLGELPDDDEVLFGRVDGMGQIVHVTELEGAAAPSKDPRGPVPSNEQAWGRPCPACQVPLEEGDMVAVLPIGPGADPDARVKAKAGQPYECVHIEIHWACLTGDEAYDAAKES